MRGSTVYTIAMIPYPFEMCALDSCYVNCGLGTTASHLMANGVFGKTSLLLCKQVSLFTEGCSNSPCTSSPISCFNSDLNCCS